MDFERTLNLTIHLDQSTCKISFLEPDSGEHTEMEFPVSAERHPLFNEMIGNEVYSWISLWLDEMEQEDEP